MRSNCSVYIDAGYLLASAATRVTGTSLRNGIHVEFGKLVDATVREAEEASGLPALRVHWYDSAKDGVPDRVQERIGELPKVKLRLGRFGVDGQQKGVDLRIGLDLVAHARNGTADVFFLVSGDDDLTEAVEEAQALGVQVIVLAVPNASDKPHGVSRHLIRAADDLRLLQPATIDGAVMKVEAPAPPPEPVETPPAGEAPAASRIPSPSDLANKVRHVIQPSTPAQPAPPESVLAYSGSTGRESEVAGGFLDATDYEPQIDAVVGKVLASFRQSSSLDDIAALVAGRPSIPREIDKALLLDLCELLDIWDLPDPIRFRLRDRFWEAFDEN